MNDDRYVLMLGGFRSSSRFALNQLAGLVLYLHHVVDLRPENVAEVSYRFGTAGPEPYAPVDTERPLGESLSAVRESLLWFQSRVPPGASIHLIGYSLGGALLLEAALRESRVTSIRSITTLSSPINGSDVGPFGGLLGLFGSPVLASPAGHDLCARGGDQSWRGWVASGVSRLRAQGVLVNTLVAEGDSIVTVEDGVVALDGEARRSVLRCRAWQSDSDESKIFGHGPILRDPTCWRIIAETIGGA